MSSSTPSQNGHSEPGSMGSVQDLLYDDPASERSSQLRDLLHLLWGGKWIILGVVVLTVAGAAAYTYSISTVYRTSSLLMVDRDGGNSVLSDLGGGRNSFLRKDQTLQNELLILRQSRTIARRVAKRLRNMGTHPDTGAPLQIVRDAAGNRLSLPAVAGRVKSAISAYPSGEDTNGLYISATTDAAREASLIANLYAEAYIQRTKEKSRADLTASRKFLEQQADTLRKDVQAAERRLQEYMSREQAVSLDQETGRLVERISDLESRRAELQIETDMQRASVESLKQEIDTIESQLAERVSSTLDERLSRAQEKKAELEARIETIERENPNLAPGSRQFKDLRRLKARADRLGQKADSLATQYVQESLSAGGVAGGSGEEGGGGGVGYVVDQRRTLAQEQIELNGLRARLDVINERLRENRQSLQEIPTKSIRMAQLQRERRSTEQVYNFVQEKLQEARLAEQSEIGYAEVVSPAGPGRPIGPDTRKNLMLGLLLGLVLGGGLVILRDRLDTRIYQPDDLEDHGHSVLGVVPSMDALIDTDFDGNDTVQMEDRAVYTTLAMLVSPMSAPAEAYRRIRTSLAFARPDEGVQSLSVSSADKGAGKTTTCANLALALASAGERTVVLDADLRRPWLHTLFDRNPEPGLPTVLYDDADIASFSTAIDNLTIVPAGADVPNPAELLGSTRMQDLLRRLENEFDYVLIDTPPVLLFSDVLGLAPHCDASLLVARAGATDGSAFDHSVDRLRDVDAAVLGCVLNQFDASSATGYYGGGASYYGYAYASRRMADYYADGDRTSAVSGRLRQWWNG